MGTAEMPQHLPGVLRSLEPTLNHFGYAAVLGLIFVEDFGLPVPGETVLILAAVYAGTGRFSVLFVGLLGLLGAVAGDNVGFAMGHLGGRPLIDHYGRYILLTHDRVERATGFFARYGGGIIVVARFIVGLRQANGIIAGLSGLRWARFLTFNAIGAALWVAAWTSVGYFSGDHIDTIYGTISRFSAYVAVAVGAALLGGVTRHAARTRRARAMT
jgi:membrane protein DedA with SNARE-associated domain